MEAEAVEVVGVGEDGCVEAYGVGGDFDDYAGGDVLAVGEGEGFVDVAGEGSWWRFVRFFLPIIIFILGGSGKGKTC